MQETDNVTSFLTESENTHKTRLELFVKSTNAMIATNDRAYNGLTPLSSYDRIYTMRDYTPERIDEIIERGTLLEQQQLSENYFHRNGYYHQILLYYATLLKYVGLLIPNPGKGKGLSTNNIQKKYFQAMDLVEGMKIPSWAALCARKALIFGTYYGVRIDKDKNHFTVLDLPTKYCRSRFKDIYGRDLIEFDLSYFNTIPLPDSRQMALDAYPKEIAKAYKKYAKGKIDNWFIIPAEIGICFPFVDGRPPFLSILPATILYDEAVAKKAEKDAEEVKKIIVQQIPHLADGRLLFEPDEAEYIHKGTVQMLKNQPNVSVLTTYADVDAILSKTTDDNSASVLDRAEKNIYAQGGVSNELFVATGSGTLPASVNKDIALMMTLANAIADYITATLNEKFGHPNNVTFTYRILPVSYQNESTYIDTTFKLVANGYSTLVPFVALGFSQKDLGNLKDLENNVLNLSEKMTPPQSAYTQPGGEDVGGKTEGSDDENAKDADKQGGKTEDVTKEQKKTSGLQGAQADEGGRPTKTQSQKTEKTIKTQESRR